MGCASNKIKGLRANNDNKSMNLAPRQRTLCCTAGFSHYGQQWHRISPNNNDLFRQGCENWSASIHGKAEGRVFLMLHHIIYLEDFAVCGPWSILWLQSRLSCWVGLEQKTTKPTMPRMALPWGFFWLCKPPILIKDGHIGIQCSGRTAKSNLAYFWDKVQASVTSVPGSPCCTYPWA